MRVRFVVPNGVAAAGDAAVAVGPEVAGVETGFEGVAWGDVVAYVAAEAERDDERAVVAGTDAEGAAVVDAVVESEGDAVAFLADAEAA